MEIDDDENEMSDNTDAALFIATLLVAAPVAHMLHLSTRSFAEHKALERLYSELPSAVDELAECYQGCYGRIGSYPRVMLPRMEKPSQFVAGLVEFVEDNRENVSDDSQIQNVIDEIAQLLDSTAYQLTLS